MISQVQITVERIRLAKQAIQPFISQTPLMEAKKLHTKDGHPIFLKSENLQRTGSFKLRGATNAILALTKDQRLRGVVGVSTGNHGRGLAHAARKNGVRCIICMSCMVPQNKIDGIKTEGAEVRIVGASQDDAQIEVDKLVAEEGMTLLPPFDHPDVSRGKEQ